MTDETDFEARVRRDLDAIAGTVADVPAGTFLDRPETATSSRRPWLAPVAAGVLLVVGIVWVLNDGGSESGPADVVARASTTTAPSTTALSSTTSTPDSTDAAPPSQTGAHRIWMSTSLVSPAGTDVVFAVVGPPTGTVYGVETSLDRWDGEAWVPEHLVVSCADSWNCWGEPGDLTGQVVPRIGLGVASSGVGPAEYVRLSGLGEGWFRLRKGLSGPDGEEVATAVFWSSDAVSATQGAPAPAVEGERLRVSPIVTSDQGSRLTVSTLVSETNVLPPKLVLHHYADRSWQFVAVFDTFSVSNRAGSAIELLLPALAPGAYRLANAEGVVDQPIGRFWVGDEPLDATPCQAFTDLGELLGAIGSDFGAARAPDLPQRASTTPGGFRVQWDGPTSSIVYSFPVGGVTDLVGERTVVDGPVMLWYRGDAVEAWVQLPGCVDEDPVTAGFTVSGGVEQENVTLALRLGRELARLHNPDFAVTPRIDCPGPDSPDPDTPNAVHTVWMYCRTSADQVSELVPVPTIFSPDDPIEAVIRRSLGDPWNGLEAAIPVELRGALTTVEIVDGLLTIDWGWDFAVSPIDNMSTSGMSGRIIDQVAANGFQFDEIDAIDLSSLPGEHGGEFIYTREQWEQAHVEN